MAIHRFGRFVCKRFYCRQRTVSVDTSSIFGQRASVPQNPALEHGLLRELARHIRFHGPLSVKEFMTVALTHPLHGYYMRGNIFGRSGDFVTSPELSQTFGELLGIWCVACWQQLGKPPAIRLAELGPGRGTLMADLLQSSSVFNDFHAALSVHMVEVSPHLSHVQRSRLSATPLSKHDGSPDEPTIRWTHRDITPEVQARRPSLSAQLLLRSASPA